MELKELVGKKAIRIEPVSIHRGLSAMAGLAGGLYGNTYPDKDYLYCATPIIIVKVTEHHVYFIPPFNKDGTVNVLNPIYVDDKWTEYDPPSHKEVQKIMDALGETLMVRTLDETK